MKPKYAVVIEKAPNNYSAYVPDLQCCVAAAETREETLKLIREGIEIYIETSIESGDPVPQPRMSLEDAMSDYLSIDGSGYRDPDTGEWVEYEFQTLEVAFLMVEVGAELTAARAVEVEEPAVGARA